MVLLVDPNEEVLGFVVPDTAGVGPVTGLNEISNKLENKIITYHTGAGEKWRNWLIEQKVIIDELILLLLGHGGQGIVLALQFTVQL